MSPLAKLLQIKPTEERPSKDKRSVAAKAWARFMELLRSTRVRRRVRRLEVIERVALGNKQSVVLVRVDERELVVGCCGDSVVLLSPTEANVTPAAVPAKIVKKQLKRRPSIKAIESMVAQPVLAQTIQTEPVVRMEQVATVPQAEPEVVEVTPTVKAKPAGKKAKVHRRTKLTVKNVPTQQELIKSFAGRA
jgi:flagellar biogenesis protein FliO